jgi:hypothetical protein
MTINQPSPNPPTLRHLILADEERDRYTKLTRGVSALLEYGLGKCSTDEIREKVMALLGAVNSERIIIPTTQPEQRATRNPHVAFEIVKMPGMEELERLINKQMQEVNARKAKPAEHAIREGRPSILSRFMLYIEAMQKRRAAHQEFINSQP